MGGRGPGAGERVGGGAVEARRTAFGAEAGDAPHTLVTPVPVAGCGKRAGSGSERVFVGLGFGIGKTFPRFGRTIATSGSPSPVSTPIAGSGKPPPVIGGSGTVRLGKSGADNGRTVATIPDTALASSVAIVVAGSTGGVGVATGGGTVGPPVCETAWVTSLTALAVACATAAITCVTGPLSPGLAMRMEMFVFDG